MSTFIPKKNNLFYLERKPRVIEINDTIVNGSIVQLKKTLCFSNNEYINRCIGSDDYSIAYEIVSAPGTVVEMIGKKFTIVKSKGIFHPVGPEVKEALSLLEGPDDVILKKEMS